MSFLEPTARHGHSPQGLRIRGTQGLDSTTENSSPHDQTRVHTVKHLPASSPAKQDRQTLASQRIFVQRSTNPMPASQLASHPDATANQPPSHQAHAQENLSLFGRCSMQASQQAYARTRNHKLLARHIDNQSGTPANENLKPLPASKRTRDASQQGRTLPASNPASHLPS